MTQSNPGAAHLGERLFRIAVVADTHLNQDEADCTSPFAVNALANARTRYVVQAINREQPDLVIHLGDLIHPVPSLPSYGRAADEFHVDQCIIRTFAPGAWQSRRRRQAVRVGTLGHRQGQFSRQMAGAFRRSLLQLRLRWLPLCGDQCPDHQ